MPSEHELVSKLQSEPSELIGQEPDESKLWKVHLGDRVHEATYQQAFVLGHDLLRQRKYESAASVFQQLSHVTDRGPRAHIMLAICKSGLSQFSEAFAVLKRAPGLFESLAAAIYDVIVQSRMGFKEDALHDLMALVNEHKHLPTLCLWLGDMLEASQRPEKALQSWGLAIKRDRSGGAVRLAAIRQMRRLAGPPASSLPSGSA